MKNRSIAKCAQTLLVFLLAAGSSLSAATITYTADNNIIANPERGYWTFNSNNFGSQGLPSPLSDMINYLNGLRQSHGMTTVVATYGLSAWKTTALPQSVLDLIDNDCATARANGYKLLFRHSYTDTFNSDPAIARIEEHLRQLTPVFAKNADVLCVIHVGGAYGRWGEQWGSQYTNYEGTPGTTGRTLTDDTKTILRAMLASVPRDRMMMMRYERPMRQFFGTDIPCPSSEAFMGTTPRSRIGHYNDCFLSEGSAETSVEEGPWSYTSIQGDYTPDLAVDMSCTDAYTDQLVIDNLDKQHFDFVWLDNGKLSSGCLTELNKYVGYRYRLLSATAADQAKPGNAFALSLNMTNDGYSGIFNPRKIEIILRNQAGGAKYILNVVGDDTIRYNRTYLPKSHETKTLTITGGIPATMPAGNYDVILNLPDPYLSIHDRPEYSIHLANTGVWESSTGYNKLNHTLQVSASAGGSAYTGSNWFSLNGIPTTIQTASPRGMVPTSRDAITYYSLSGKKLITMDGGAKNPIQHMVIRQSVVNGRQTFDKILAAQKK